MQIFDSWAGILPARDFDKWSQMIDVIVAAFSAGPSVFNLGAGVLPRTPLQHVERLVERVRRVRPPG